jgi:hypothetical protein
MAMHTTCAVNVAGGFLGNFLALAKQVFLLGFVKLIERQRARFNVENEFGHHEWFS